MQCNMVEYGSYFFLKVYVSANIGFMVRAPIRGIRATIFSFARRLVL